jgi:integrase
MQDVGEVVTRNGTWARKYGSKHRWERLANFPVGIQGPKKVRIYRRGRHFILNWWDPGCAKNLSERVDGDLLAVLARAREIDERVHMLRTAGAGQRRRIGHAQLTEEFLADLESRADAGELAPGTIPRYRAALGHYLAYCEQPAVAKTWSTVAVVNRDFRLGLSKFLQHREVYGNGRAGSVVKRMRGQRFVLDTVRAMYEWAGDSERGNLLPSGFKNPFLRNGEKRCLLQGDPLAEPDITMPMATGFLSACDDYELTIFVPLVLFGLRAAEPRFLFREHLQSDWLLVPNIPELDYKTKGRRDKRFPLPTRLASFWKTLRSDATVGLLIVRREVADGREKPPLLGNSLDELKATYRNMTGGTVLKQSDRIRLRDRIIADAGGTNYDEIESLYDRIRRRLGWPSSATLKDFRHLFATTLANAGMPEGYRKYLLGHAPGRDAAVAYTHLNKLREAYDRIVSVEYAEPLLLVENRFPGE